MKKFIVRILPLAAVAMFAAGCATTETAPEQKPAAETKPASTGATASTAMMSYNVVRGDHLWGISSKPTIYGNPYQWPLIFKSNRDKIKDADLIEPGQVLSIEKNPSAADVNAAVDHAKHRGEWKIGATEKSDLDYLAKFGKK